MLAHPRTGRLLQEDWMVSRPRPEQAQTHMCLSLFSCINFKSDEYDCNANTLREGGGSADAGLSLLSAAAGMVFAPGANASFHRRAVEPGEAGRRHLPRRPQVAPGHRRRHHCNNWRCG